MVAQVVKSATKEVLEKANVDSQLWEMSNMFYVSQNNEEILMMHFFLAKDLLSKLPINKELSLEEYKNLLKRQNELLEEENKKKDEYAKIIVAFVYFA
jgi:hypothetical protein